MRLGYPVLYSWIFLGALTAGLGCFAPPTNSTPGSEAVAAYLQSVGEGVMVPTLDRFLVATENLEQSLHDWAAAETDADQQDARLSAQEDWEAAMLIWQELEVMQVGPAGAALSTIAGADIRDEIYSWPTVSPCRVDQETVAQGFLSPEFFSDNLVNSYGMDALEHMLWAGMDNTCPTQTDINADGSWDALDAQTLHAHRTAFSLALIDNVQDQTQALRAAWLPDGEDFSGQLSLSTSGPYTSTQQALNEVFDSLFYLESVTREEKLATPLGLNDCLSDCAATAEHLDSGISIAAVEANLLGFQTLFTGGQGAGMDDLLITMGHGDLSDEILTAVDDALALCAVLSGPLDEQLALHPDDVMALHDAVRAVTDRVESDLATVLALTLPAEAAGDND